MEGEFKDRICRFEEELSEDRSELKGMKKRVDEMEKGLLVRHN